MLSSDLGALQPAVCWRSALLHLPPRLYCTVWRCDANNSWSEPSCVCHCVWWFQGPSLKGSKSKLNVSCSRRPSVPFCGKGSEMDVRVVERAGPVGAVLNYTEF